MDASILTRLLSSEYTSQQNEAIRLVNLYGKDIAVQRCEDTAINYRNKIKETGYYDPELIDSYEEKIRFYIDVKILIDLWL